MRIRNMILPSAYQRVEYIESTGTQYISLQDFNYQNQVEIDFKKVSDGNSNSALFGFYSSSSDAYALYTNTNGIYAGTSEKIGTYDSGFTSGTRYIYKSLNNGIYINGTKIFDRGTPYNYNRDILIFGRNGSAWEGTLGSYRVYSFKIKSNQNVMLNNFIPCYRKSDNFIGLYDLVNGVFYTNAGTGTFLKGGNVTDKCKVSYAPILNSIPTLSDTLSTTNSNYVFTKKLGVADIGSFSGCILLSSNQFYFDLGNAKHPDSSTTLANIFCEKYERETYVDVYNKTKNKTIALNTNGWALVYDTSYSTVSDFLNAMSGVLLTYELATYQTITIPRRHCGLVDLGTLSWSPIANQGMASISINSVAKNGGKCICGKYLYSATVWNSGCIGLNSSSTLCVADTSYTSGSAFKNAMKGVYLYYETQNEVSDLPTTLNPRLSLLPSDYQEVEYIESSGTQYIDSGFKANKNVGIEVKVEFISMNDYLSIFGGRIGGNDEDFQLYTNTQGKGNLRLGTSTSERSFPLNQDLVITQKNGVLSINGNEFTNLATTTWDSSTYNTYIFATNTSGTPNFLGTEKLYYLKFYENNVLVHNFVPCYRKSDNEIGLYDTITQTFFTNAGTGTFTKGNNKNTII